MSNADLRTRWLPRPLSLIVLVVLLAAAIASGLVARNVVHGQQEKLLRGQGQAAGSVLTASISSIQSTMFAIGGLTSAPDPDPGALETVSASLRPQGDPPQFAGVAVVDTSGPPRVLRDVFGGLTGDDLALGERTALLDTAAACTPGRDGACLFSSPVFEAGGDRRVAFAAAGEPAVPEGRAVYYEVGLGPLVAAPNDDGAFTDVDAVLYATPGVDASQALITTTGRAQLDGDVVVEPLSAGRTQWSIAVSAKRSLVGGFASWMPWLLLLGGVVVALLVTAVVDTLARRRERIEDLVTQRTAELTRSLEDLAAAQDQLVRAERLAAMGERTGELAALRAASAAVSDSLTLDEVLAVSVGIARTLTGARAAAIYVVSSDEPYRMTLRRRDGEPWRLPAGLDWSVETVESRRIGAPQREALVVTLTGGGQQVGALVLSEVERWSADFLHTLATQLGLAVQNAQRFERERDTVARLSELARMKNDFLAAVSHELRTPLTVVIGFAETLLRRGRDLPPERRDALLERIVAQGARLSRLVDDLIDATGLESGLTRVETGPVDAVAVVRRAVATFQRGDHTVEVDIPPDLPPVVADATRLEQVLVNLLDNARKYTPDGGCIRVVGSEEAHEVVVTVVDNGIGVAPEFLQRMFEPFAQADTGDTRTDQGVGLGLSIANGLVRGMGGRIEASSVLGKGTSVAVRLVASAVPATTPRPLAAG